MNFRAGRAIYLVRNGANLAHAAAKASCRLWFRRRLYSCVCAAIGSRITEVEWCQLGTFIVPGW